MIREARYLGNVWRAPSSLQKPSSQLWRSIAINSGQSRGLATEATSTAPKKKEGDISSAFVSLSGQDAKPLDPKYIDIKRHLIAGHEEAVQASFYRLLKQLKHEIAEIKTLGSSIIPSIDFSDLASAPLSFSTSHRKHGVAIIRNVLPPSTALSLLDTTRAYIRANPSTKAFPPSSPAVYELYWSPAQIQARAHPNLLAAQRFLMSQHWHAASDPDALLSTRHPISYADRLRIRPPGDAQFALGPHVDGGSCERWEPAGYGRGGVYKRIFAGEWEAYDPFDGAARLPVVSDLYNGAGACSAFRMYQGWLSLSRTGPGEGTLLVNPLFSRATAYYLLRPFFAPRDADPAKEGFLEAGNWDFEGEVSSALQGAYPGHGQELNAALHPHLELEKSMVHVPLVQPGDYIAWHCDTIHAVDSVHKGDDYSSVLYIPSCPLTEETAHYLVRQRHTFLEGTPSPDFPGGKGESEHIGRPGPELSSDGSSICPEGQRAMGLREWDVMTAESEHEKKLLQRANEILGL